MTSVINLWAGPGAGKSTIAAELFAELKWAGHKAELVTEYAKELHWEGSFDVQKNQTKLLGEQYHRQWRLLNKVDFIVTDSPLLLGLVYAQYHNLMQPVQEAILKHFLQFNNVNFFIRRRKGYAEYGRSQTETEAIDLDRKIENTLRTFNLQFEYIDGDRTAAKRIYNILAKDLDL